MFLFLDPCHALKLVRNTFGDYVLVDSQERGIKFSDVRELFDLNQEKEIYSAPRLTKRHIQWRENKMRVRLAAQVLSSSVAAGLLHALKKGFQRFCKCAGTAEFCQQFDRIFDILNCRSIFSKKRDYNIPVMPRNIPKFQTWVADAETYIQGLQIVENAVSPKKPRESKKKPNVGNEGQIPPVGSGEERELQAKFIHWSKRECRPVLEHRRKTGFLGFLMCLCNLIPLFLSLQLHGLKYLLTYKLSQDHLETWFSAARSKGGCNNNPNAEQFKAIFKRLLVHHELRTANNANCEGDDTKILTVSSRSEKKKGTSLPNRLLSDDYSDDVLNSMVIEDFSESDITVNLDEYQADCVAYISGFIIRKMEEKKLGTSREVKNLTDPLNHSDLIDLKNRGKLKLPSKIIVSICAIVEKIFRIHEQELLHPDRRRSAVVEDLILDYLEENGYTDTFGPHITTLIVQLYLRIKIRYACKVLSTVERDIRHTSKKAPIFNHQ